MPTLSLSSACFKVPLSYSPRSPWLICLQKCTMKGLQTCTLAFLAPGQLLVEYHQHYIQ